MTGILLEAVGDGSGPPLVSLSEFTRWALSISTPEEMETPPRHSLTSVSNPGQSHSQTLGESRNVNT